MKDDKAEGAEFLRRLGILIMGLGALAAVGMIYAGVEANRITSYNVCYTKLLRLCQIQLLFDQQYRIRSPFFSGFKAFNA